MGSSGINAATSISKHASKLLRDHGVYSLIFTYPDFSNLRDCNEATASFAHPPIFRISEFATLQHPFPHMPPNSSEITGSTASFAHTPIFRISEISEFFRIYSLICTHPDFLFWMFSFLGMCICICTYHP